jgi:ParB family transcriptional regulator, chromosome partitioning protein
MNTSTISSNAANVLPSTFAPLSSLFLSPGNVRKAPTHIDELAAMIDAQGLLCPLHVTPALSTKKQGLRYAVEAGGRRLRALNLLVSQGKLAEDAPIEIRLIEAGKALEISLTENVSHEPMHPADEFEAYRALVDQGQTFEAISIKFGVTVLHVQRRLKMAQVAPDLLTLYRAGGITLDQIMALASVDDHERQLQVWKSLPNYSRNSQSIKSKLSEEELPVTDERVVVIGLDNYLAAGGAIRADLFCDESTQYLTDPALVDMMLGELLEGEAAKVRGEGWAWVEVFATYGYNERQLHTRLRKKYLPESSEQNDARAALEAEFHTLEAAQDEAQEADDWDKSILMGRQIAEIETRLETLKESRLDLDGFDKTIAGAVVTVSDGAIVVHRGLAKVADTKKSQRGHAAQGAKGEGNTRPDVPEKLMLNLSSHRTAAIQALMLDNQHVSLSALANKMAVSVLCPSDFRTSPIKLNLIQCRSTLEKNSPTLPNSRAALALSTQREAWLERLPVDSGDWFTWLLAQPQDTVLNLIVFATAHCAEAVQGRANGADSAEPMARALSLDMADWWEPTPENYLELVPKSKLVEAVTETAGQQVAAAMLKMKKDGAIAHASQHVLGHRWLPAVLRGTPVATAQTAEINQAVEMVAAEA